MRRNEVSESSSVNRVGCDLDGGGEAVDVGVVEGDDVEVDVVDASSSEAKKRLKKSFTP